LSGPILEAKRQLPRWLQTGFWICTFIAVAAVLRRLVALAHPSQAGPPQMVTLDAVFASHATLTLAHIFPAMAFVLLTPFVIRSRPKGAWAERTFFPLGAIVGLTAYAMSFYSIGGWIERSAVLVFNSLYLLSLARAYIYMHRGQQLLKFEWMMRSVGILLGIATTRPVMGIFFATSPLTHLQVKQFFGIAFWIGFSINLLVIELWLRSRKGKVLMTRVSSQTKAFPATLRTFRQQSGAAFFNGKLRKPLWLRSTPLRETL
jgi:predicted membrane protein DUF2306